MQRSRDATRVQAGRVRSGSTACSGDQSAHLTQVAFLASRRSWLRTYRLARRNAWFHCKRTEQSDLGLPVGGGIWLRRAQTFCSVFNGSVSSIALAPFCQLADLWGTRSRGQDIGLFYGEDADPGDSTSNPDRCLNNNCGEKGRVPDVPL